MTVEDRPGPQESLTTGVSSTQPPTAPAAVIARNFNYLFARFGSQLGVGSLISDRVNYIHRLNTGLSRTTIRGFLDGTGSPHPQTTTLDLLVHAFKEILPNFKGDMLREPDEATFTELVKNAGVRNSIAIEVPDYAKNIPSLAKWMSGTFVAYRYAFEGDSDAYASREVLHIWMEKDETLRFRMSYWSRTAEPGQQAMEFTGHVLPIGQSIMFIGLSRDHPQRNRGRSLFFYDDRAVPKMRSVALGLMTSTRLHGDWAPCVASTLLIRLEKEPSDLNAFIQDASLIDDTGTMLRNDFGLRHNAFIRAFLDNRPRGSIIEKDLQTLDLAPGADLSTAGTIKPEAVLRLNRQRFDEAMPNILADVLSDKTINAPFKAGWKKLQTS